MALSYNFAQPGKVNRAKQLQLAPLMRAMIKCSLCFMTLMLQDGRGNAFFIYGENFSILPQNLCVAAAASAAAASAPAVLAAAG
jgi:hypothetical protein